MKSQLVITINTEIFEIGDINGLPARFVEWIAVGEITDGTANGIANGIADRSADAIAEGAHQWVEGADQWPEGPVL